MFNFMHFSLINKALGLLCGVLVFYAKCVLPIPAVLYIGMSLHLEIYSELHSGGKSKSSNFHKRHQSSWLSTPIYLRVYAKEEL